MAERDQVEHKAYEEADEVERVSLKLAIQHPETYLYSNVAGVSISPMDFRIDFADATVDGRCQTVVGVTMSAEHAASFVVLMMRQLLNFEAQFGVVRTPQWREFRDALGDKLIESLSGVQSIPKQSK